MYLWGAIGYCSGKKEKKKKWISKMNDHFTDVQLWPITIGYDEFILPLVEWKFAFTLPGPVWASGQTRARTDL